MVLRLELLTLKFFTSISVKRILLPRPVFSDILSFALNCSAEYCRLSWTDPTRMVLGRKARH